MRSWNYRRTVPAAGHNYSSAKAQLYCCHQKCLFAEREASDHLC